MVGQVAFSTAHCPLLLTHLPLVSTSQGQRRAGLPWVAVRIVHLAGERMGLNASPCPTQQAQCAAPGACIWSLLLRKVREELAAALLLSLVPGPQVGPHCIYSSY